MEPGEHIAAYRVKDFVVPIFHHGIYMGGGRVIDFDEDGCSEKTFADFKNGCKVFAIAHDDAQPGETVCARAREALTHYKQHYNIMWQNCEHFVNKIITGRDFSLQSNLAVTLGATAALGAGALALGAAHMLEKLKTPKKKSK